MIDRDHALSISRQAQLVGISRGSVYYRPKPVNTVDLELMRHIDELHLDTRSWAPVCFVTSSIEKGLMWVASMLVH